MVVVLFVVAAALIVLLLAACSNPSSTNTDSTLQPALSKKGVLKLIAEIDGFTPAKTVVKGSALEGIAFDIDSKRVALVVALELMPKKGSHYNQIVIKKFDDLIECRVIVDGKTVTTVNKASQILNTAAGALIAGGTGAILGGLSASSTTKQIVRGVRVELLINDLKYPRHSIDFVELTWSGQTTMDSALREATELHDYVRVIMHQAKQAA